MQIEPKYFPVSIVQTISTIIHTISPLRIVAEAEIAPPPHGSKGKGVREVVVVEGLQPREVTGDCCQHSTSITGAGTPDHARLEQMIHAA